MTDSSPPPGGRVAPEMGSHNLLCVVPVGQQQHSGNFALLIYSLELYTSGFVAIVRLSWIGGSGMAPRLNWTAQDEHGTTFPYADMAGSGGGLPPEHFSWRLGCMFGAPIPANSSRLDLTATVPGAASTEEPMRYVIHLDDHASA